MKKTTPDDAMVQVGTVELAVTMFPADGDFVDGARLLERMGNQVDAAGPLGIDLRPVVAPLMADVVAVRGVLLDHSEAERDELVWSCDFCGRYSKTREIVLAHEKVCEYGDRNV